MLLKEFVFFSVVYSTSISNKIEYTFKCTSDGSEGSLCNMHFFEKFEFWFVKVAKLAAVQCSHIYRKRLFQLNQIGSRKTNWAFCFALD